MIPTDPTAAVSVVSHLYSTGAFLCMGIVIAYLALTYASKHVAWLEVPGRAHYVTIGLAVAAIFVLPATQGTTPNASMLGTAAATLIALLLPGTPPSTDPALPVAKIAKIGGVALLALAIGCATLKTMSGAFAVCAKADLGQIVTSNGLTLAQDVEQLIDGNGPNLEGDLLALAGKVTLDAVDCAVTAYQQTHASGSAAVSAELAASPVPSPSVIGLSRALEWISSQRKAGK